MSEPLYSLSSNSEDIASHPATTDNTDDKLESECWTDMPARMYSTCPDAIANRPIPEGTCDFDNSRWLAQYETNVNAVTKAGCDVGALGALYLAQSPMIWNSNAQHTYLRLIASCVIYFAPDDMCHAFSG